MERTTFIQKLIYRLSAILFAMSTIVGWFNIKPDCVLFKVDTLCTHQEITGWGTSAAWWAQMAGKSEKAEDYAKLLYSEEGLGLNIYRYNVGAGEKENPDSRIWDAKNSWRAAESFLIYNEATGEYEYDWNQDKAAQDMLDLCLSYGCIDTVVLFANSPHYSMCVSGHASGGLEPAQSNLKKDCYDDFAEYMLDIAEYFIGKGVPVKYISPINEPQWDWGGDWVGQEACHYEIDEVIELGKVFAAEIKERGLDVKLSLAESGQVGDHAMDCIDKIYENQDIVDVLGTYSYHSYWTNDFLLKKAYGEYIGKNYPKVELEMSEWCELPCEHDIDDIEGALIMARTISEDVTLTGVNSWSSWVAVNQGGVRADSMISASDDCNSYEIAKRYYAMAHFSKFVPVGSKAVNFDVSIGDIKAEEAWWTSQIIDGKEYPVYLIENNMNVSAFRTPEGDYVAVIVNQGSEKNFRVCMPFYDVKAYTTDADRNLELTHDSCGVTSVNIPAKSITTITFER